MSGIIWAEIELRKRMSFALLSHGLGEVGPPTSALSRPSLTATAPLKKDKKK